MRPFLLLSRVLALSLVFSLEFAAAGQLAIERGVRISFPTVHGMRYQLQSSMDPSSSSAWVDEGAVLVGDGDDVLVSLEIADTKRFYRLQEQGEPTLTQAKKDEINLHLDQAIANYEIPGIIAGVQLGDEAPWLTARGVSDLETQEPLTVEDRFRIGSASKTFVAMTVLQLIHEGRLEFDALLGPFLTEEEKSALNKYDLDNISVRMLLRHTSGIQNYTENIPNWFVPYINDRTRVWTDLELLQLANEVGDPISTPGTIWSYSNSNYVLLGIVVERITGNTIGQEISSRWIDSLNLSGTEYPVPGESEIPGDQVAHGYMNWRNFLNGEESVPDGLQDVTVYDPSGVGAAGPMISTAGDLLHWVYSIGHGRDLIGDLNHGHIDWRYFRASGVDPQTYAVSLLSYGMGIAHESDPNNNANYYIVGHRGQISGYDTAMQFLPEQDTAIVVVCNRSLKNGPDGEDFPGNSNVVALNFIVNVLYPELIEATQIPEGSQSLQSVSRAPVEIEELWAPYSLFSTGTTMQERLEAKRGTIRWPLSEYGN